MRHITVAHLSFVAHSLGSGTDNVHSCEGEVKIPGEKGFDYGFCQGRCVVSARDCALFVSIMTRTAQVNMRITTNHKRPPSMPPVHSRKSLEAMKRGDLQRLCKVGVRSDPLDIGIFISA
jgi:hypothetical protein